MSIVNMYYNSKEQAKAGDPVRVTTHELEDDALEEAVDFLTNNEGLDRQNLESFHDDGGWHVERQFMSIADDESEKHVIQFYL